MIYMTFRYGGEILLVRVIDNEVSFMTPLTGGKFYPIDNLYISKNDAIEQFPDLKDNENWRKEAIKRLKCYIGCLLYTSPSPRDS